MITQQNSGLLFKEMTNFLKQNRVQNCCSFRFRTVLCKEIARFLKHKRVQNCTSAITEGGGQQKGMWEKREWEVGDRGVGSGRGEICKMG